MANIKLTWEEKKEIANRLDKVIGNYFHDAMYDVIFERAGHFDGEVSDEDIMEIKEQLKRIL